MVNLQIVMKRALATAVLAITSGILGSSSVASDAGATSSTAATAASDVVEVVYRLTLWNVFDRVNLIRSSGGLGVYESAYGPRRTLLDAALAGF